MDNKIALKIKNLSYKINSTKVLDNINFEIKSGEIVYILGANGSGKTTLIKCILGLIKEYTGNIEIFGTKQSQQVVSNYIGYVPQYNNIERDFPISVREMIELECSNKLHCNIGPEGHLDMFSSSKLIDKKINDLSGGEFQKVLISRALTTDPEILILDEPINNLDQESQIKLIEFLNHLNEEHGKTILIVTHDKSIINLSNPKQRGIFLHDGELEIGAAQDILKKYKLH